MEAIEVITSKSELVMVPDMDGKIIQIEKMFWNPTIANLTLMALGSSAPEIILSIADTMGTMGKIPSELGPQAIVGSASFNLLVISAVSIVAVTEFKKIKMVGVFITTAIASTFAYIWFFLTLVVISPGVVELWEAILTLGFMLILVALAYGCDKLHESGETESEKREAEKRKVTKAAIRNLSKRFGIRTLIEVGQGERRPDKLAKPNQPDITDEEIKMTVDYFTILLTEDPADPKGPEDASIDELLECLASDNAVERIMYRKEVNVGNNKSFLKIEKLEKGTKSQAAQQKLSTANDSKTVGFKHLRYEVAESNEYVTITIEKRVAEDVSFWVRTKDGTAKAGSDYEEKNEFMTMHAGDSVREIKIKIHDDPDWEPDEEFQVWLLSEDQQLIPGADTKCTVMIQDEDKPGSIGFPETMMEVKKSEKTVMVELVRQGGSDGSISCTLNTVSNEDLVPGKRAAKEGKDFIPIKDKTITFNPGEVTYKLEVHMPDIVEVEGELEDIDTVSFALQISDPMPTGTQLSKKRTLFINIE